MSAMCEITQEMLERLNEELASELGLSNGWMSARSRPSEQMADVSIIDHLIQRRVETTPEDLTRFDSVLDFLSSDVPRGNGTFFDANGRTVAEYWLGVMWVGASLGVSAKEKLRAWSMTSARYDQAGFEAAWNSYNFKHPNPVGMGALLKFAKARGWSDPVRQPASLQATTKGYKLLDRGDILSQPVTPWRVKKIFPVSGLGAVYGPSASGKSFLAMDLACAIVDGDTWFGHKTYMCPVTYVMLEGEAGLAGRIHAWEKAKCRSLPTSFRAITQTFRLTDLGNLTDMLDALPKNGVVFLDTLNRAAPTTDENSSAEMGEVLQAAKNLQLGTEGLVIVVHHTGKDVSRGMRGHSSLFAALDGAIEVQRTDDKRSWTVAKSKDAEDGGVVLFRLERHVLGCDADGDEITSCTVEPDVAQILTPREPSGAKQKIALRTVRQALLASNQFGIAGCGSGVSCMTVEDAKAAVAATLTTEEPNKRKNRAKSLIEGLINGGFLGTGADTAGDGWLWKL